MNIISVGNYGDEIYVVLDSSYTVTELEEIVRYMKEINKTKETNMPDDEKVDVEKEADLEAEQKAKELEEAAEKEQLEKALEEAAQESDVPGIDPEEEIEGLGNDEEIEGLK